MGKKRKASRSVRYPATRGTRQRVREIRPISFPGSRGRNEELVNNHGNAESHGVTDWSEMSDAGLAIEAHQLKKTFGETRAVDGVDLAVRRGTVYGVLGPNGAGKTTTIRMLATLLRPEGGSARVLGHDVVTDADAVRGKISLTGQLASVDEDLTGHENLILFGRLLGFNRRQAATRSEELLGAFGLSAAAGKQVKNFSGGMRRRLDIAASIVVPPEVLFLDEPTTGLDPRSRNQVWEIIRILLERGTTILLCTQYLDEADQLADRIAVIDHGRVIAEGTPGQLKASTGTGALRVRLLDPDQRPRTAEVLAGVLESEINLEADSATLSAQCNDPRQAAEAIGALSDGGIGIADFSLGQPSLDEVFLALTGRPAESEGDGDGAGPEEEDRVSSGHDNGDGARPAGPDDGYSETDDAVAGNGSRPELEEEVPR